MRKGIKIKVWFIFFAWMLIFVHNIIPHNHLHENVTGCHELVHSTNPTEDDCSGPLKFKSEPEDVNVCHISNLLYHQFSEDNLINYSEGVSNNFFICPAGTILFKSEVSFILDIYYGSSSLRAPPEA